MGLFDDLLHDHKKQQEYQNFANQYEQGGGAQAIPDQEVLSRYQEVATQLPPDQYQRAAEQAFSRMSPQDRMQFAQYIQQQAQQQGYNLPAMQQVPIEQYQNPAVLAQMATQMHQQQPGGLAQLLGGGGNGSGSSALSSPVAKAALAGIAAIAVKEALSHH